MLGNKRERNNEIDEEKLNEEMKKLNETESDSE